jgi:hypothetical protein
MKNPETASAIKLSSGRAINNPMHAKNVVLMENLNPAEERAAEKIRIRGIFI